MSEPFKKDASGYIATERLYLTLDGKIVQEGDHRAAQLLAVKGGRVSDKLVKRLKLDKAKVEEREESTATKQGFELKAHGGYPKAAVKTAAPEAIVERATRPERVSTTR